MPGEITWQHCNPVGTSQSPKEKNNIFDITYYYITVLASSLCDFPVSVVNMYKLDIHSLSSSGQTNERSTRIVILW